MVEERVAAWRPRVEGIHEVLHARFTEHAYPLHAHDTWTLLVVDDGAVRYDLDRHEHGAITSRVTLLPPFVAHNGRAATAGGFRKRVLYLDRHVLDDALIGPAVDRPTLADPALRQGLDRIHGALVEGTEPFEVACRMALVTERLAAHLRAAGPPTGRDAGDRQARRLRELLDANLRDGVTLEEAARLLDARPAGLVRAFRRAYGIPPHRYLTGRRVEVARRLLLAGLPPAESAVLAGFYDQAHLARHFTRMLGVPPGRFARSGPRADGAAGQTVATTRSSTTRSRKASTAASR